MNRGLLITIVSVAVIMLALVFGVVSWYNTGVSLQEGVLAQYRNNQNWYDNFWKKVKETAQVPDKYKEDFKELLATENSAKFGSEGSKAMMQWFQERDLKPDASLYTQVQKVIESGRNKFAQGQQMLLDRQQSLRKHRKGVWGKFCLNFTDYLDVMSGELAPPRDLDGDGILTALDYDIMTSKQTKEAFESGEAEAVEVF